jgi:hypothetical protein
MGLARPDKYGSPSLFMRKASVLNMGRYSTEMEAMNSRTAPPETVICAAVRASNGKIVRGHGHIDAIRALQAMDGYEGEQPRGEDQGFVTSTDRFVNRREAYRLQFPDRTAPDELQSDDLY